MWAPDPQPSPTRSRLTNFSIWTPEARYRSPPLSCSRGMTRAFRGLRTPRRHVQLNSLMVGTEIFLEGGMENKANLELNVEVLLYISVVT